VRLLSKEDSLWKGTAGWEGLFGLLAMVEVGLVVTGSQDRP
jgi:hypothetical protein